MGCILAGYNSWGHKELETPEQLNNSASIAPESLMQKLIIIVIVLQRNRTNKMCVCVCVCVNKEGFLRNWPIQLYMQLWRSLSEC